MRAIQLTGHGKPGTFSYTELPEPILQTDEVLVQVRACGVNRLELWVEEGALPIPVELPRIPGGEIAGEICALGASVTRWKVGDRVAVHSNVFCGECEFCKAGEESVCLTPQMIGIQRDGGFAEKVAVPARQLVRLPENISFVHSAALTLAGSTAIHMLTHRTTVQPGQWVLVMAGASGVGSIAIQIAKLLGAQVISTGSSSPKRDLAKELGADFVIDSSSDDWPSQARSLTKKRGVDLVVEHVGGPVLNQVLSCLAKNGTVVTCGATAGREVTLNLWPFFVRQHRLVGSYGRNVRDIEKLLGWASEGKIRPVIDRTFALSETPQAYAELRARKVLGKVLVLP